MPLRHFWKCYLQAHSWQCSNVGWHQRFPREVDSKFLTEAVHTVPHWPVLCISMGIIALEVNIKFSWTSKSGLDYFFVNGELNLVILLYILNLTFSDHISLCFCLWKELIVSPFYSDSTQTDANTKEFWVNMPNLMTHLKKVSEQKPQATYYNVDMLKYQVFCFLQNKALSEWFLAH